MTAKPPPHRPTLIAAFASLYILWGSTYFAMRLAVGGGWPPFSGAAVRMAVAGVLMWLWLRQKIAPFPSRRDLLHLAGSGFFLFVGGNALTMMAAGLAPSGLLALLGATVTFWLATGGALFFGQRLSLYTQAGIACGFLGVAILAGKPSGGAAFGVALGLIAPALWAAGGLWGRHRLEHLSASVTSTYQMLFGALWLGLIAAARGEWHALSPTTQGDLAIVYLVVAGSLLGFNSFTYLLAHVPAATVGTYAYVNPLIAVLIGTAFGHESVSWRTFAGGAVILAGVAVVNWSRRNSSGVERPVRAVPRANA